MALHGAHYGRRSITLHYNKRILVFMIPALPKDDSFGGILLTFQHWKFVLGERGKLGRTLRIVQ